jgi:hypothetical protein
MKLFNLTKRKTTIALATALTVLTSSAVVAETLTANVIDDSYIKRGSPDDNWGGTGKLQLKESSGTTEAENVGDRYIVGKYDITALQGKTITSAKLKVFAATKDAKSVKFKVKPLASDAWNEGDITWNTFHGIGLESSAGNTTIADADYKWHEIDVTEAAQVVSSTDGIFSLALMAVDDSTSYLYVRSKEYEDGSKGSYLEVEYEGGTVVTPNDYTQWDYEANNGNCTLVQVDCHIDFTTAESLSDVEDWIIAFRTGGSKDDNYNHVDSTYGKSVRLKDIDGEQALVITQSATRDPSGSRRTEVKVAKFDGSQDYRIGFDMYIYDLPTFETTVTQMKCGSGKPTINVKLGNNGALRVRSKGFTIYDSEDDGSTPFTQGWNNVEFEYDNPNRHINLKINGTSIPLDNTESSTDCQDIMELFDKDIKPYHYLKLGLYEDAIEAGFRLGYKNLSIKQL